MSSSVKGNFEIHPTRRIADIMPGFGAGSSRFTNLGDDVTDGEFDGRTGGFSLIVDSDGARERISTIATNGDYNHIRGLPIWQRRHEVNFFSRFMLPTLTSCRMFIGLTDSDPATMTQSATLPTANYCGLWKDESDTNFQFVRNDNSGGPTETPSIALSSVIHDFHMWLKRAAGADIVIFQLDNNTRLQTNTNIPSNIASMQYVAVIRTTANSIRSLDIAKIHMDSMF